MQKSRRVRGVLAHVVAAALVLAGLPSDGVHAACPGPNTAYGPCSDPGTFVTTGGPDWCGNCPAQSRVYVGGNCAGGAGTGAFDCADCNLTWKTELTTYTSTPAGPVATAACYTAWLACLGAAGAAGATCAGVCATFGPIAAGACAAICAGGIGGLCGCVYDLCVTTCTPGVPTYTGSPSSCT